MTLMLVRRQRGCWHSTHGPWALMLQCQRMTAVVKHAVEQWRWSCCRAVLLPAEDAEPPGGAAVELRLR